MIVAWEHRKEECAAKYKYILFQIAETQKTVTKVQSELKKSKEISERMRKARVKDAVGFEVKVEKILGEEAKIYKEAYHGGTLNGVCCIRLLEKNELIMNRVKSMCERRRMVTSEGDRLCTYPFMIDTLDR